MRKSDQNKRLHAAEARQSGVVTARPINWWNLVWWAYITAGSSVRTYAGKQRSLSVRRIGRALVPNLERPIFIVGAPRSGTTFLGDCLAVLPEVSYHFEPVATKAAARYVYENMWSFRGARWFYRNVYRWLMRIHLDGDLRFAEKTPRNSLIISFLANAFPGSQFIHIVRDGRDAALSLSKRPWLQAALRGSGQREPGGYLYGPYAQFWVEHDRIEEFESTSDIHRCIWSWRRHTEAAVSALEKLPPAQAHQLRYEDLVARPTEEAARLLTFIEIDDRKSRVLFDKAVERAMPDSVGRWRSELSADAIDVVDREAGSLLRRLGYTTEGYGIAPTARGRGA